MSFWSLLKVAQTTNPVVQPQVGAPKPPAQPAVNPGVTPQPAPTPAPAAPVENQQPQNGQAPQTAPVDPKAKVDPLELQKPLDPIFSQIMRDFMPGGKFFEQHAKIHHARNPDGYASALSTFFTRPGRGRNIPWMDWLSSKAGEALSGQLKVDQPQAINFNNSLTTTAIKYYLKNNPEAVSAALVSAVNAAPQDLADSVAKLVGKENKQQGQWGGSMNNAIGTEGGEVGDLIGNKGFAGVDEENNPDNVPDRDDVAEIMTRETANKLVAPEPLPGENEFAAAIAEELGRSGFVRDVFNDLGQFEHKNKGISELRNRDQVFTQAIKWPLTGISSAGEIEGEDVRSKLGDVALTNWQELAIRTGLLTLEQVTDPAFDLQSYADSIIGEFIDPQTGEPNEEFAEFYLEKSLEYMKYAYETQHAEELSQMPEEFKPKSHNFDAFSRMARVSAACSHRQWRAERLAEQAELAKNPGAKPKLGVGTAARRYAYVSTKVPAIVKKLKDASKAAPGQYIPFGNDDKTGKKKFLHRTPEGAFMLREVQFNPDIPITNDQDLQQWVHTNGKDTPITAFNWATMSQAVDRADYIPQMYEKIKALEPSGLERKKPINSALASQFLQQMQADPNATDQMAAYRQARAGHLKNFMAQSGVDPAAIASVIASRASSTQDVNNPGKPKNVRVSGPASKHYGRNIGANPDGFISNILSGQPQKYDSSDFEALAWAINEASKQTAQPIDVKADDIYAPHPTTYDIDNTDDWDDLNSMVNTSISAFGRYIIHRNRIQQLRGFADSAWSPKSIGYFLQMCQPHPNYTHFHKDYKKEGRPDDYRAEVKTPGSPLQDVIAPGKVTLHPNIMDDKDLSGTGEERLQQLDQQMSGIPRTDIYKAKGDQLNPTNPGGLRVHHDVDENGRMIRDEHGKPQNLREEISRADPNELWKTIQQSFTALHKDEATGVDAKGNPIFDIDTILTTMKQEKMSELDDLANRSRKKQWGMTALLEGSPQAAAAMSRRLNLPAPTPGQEQQFVQQNLTNYVMKMFVQNDPKVQVAVEKVTDPAKKSEIEAKRWNEVVGRSGQTPEDFARSYLSTKVERAKAETESLAKRKEVIENFYPQNSKKLPKGSEMQKIIDTLVPMKYLRRNHAGPKWNETYNTPQGPATRERQPTPFESVDTWNKVDAPTHVAPGRRHPSIPLASVVEVTVKTAASMDRLSAIRQRLLKLAMPTEFVDVMLNKLDDDYVTQLAILTRNANGGRNESANTTSVDADQVRRRMWSLL